MVLGYCPQPFLGAVKLVKFVVISGIRSGILAIEEVVRSFYGPLPFSMQVALASLKEKGLIRSQRPNNLSPEIYSLTPQGQKRARKLLQSHLQRDLVRRELNRLKSKWPGLEDRDLIEEAYKTLGDNVQRVGDHWVINWAEATYNGKFVNVHKSILFRLLGLYYGGKYEVENGFGYDANRTLLSDCRPLLPEQFSKDYTMIPHNVSRLRRVLEVDDIRTNGDLIGSKNVVFNTIEILLVIFYYNIFYSRKPTREELVDLCFRPKKDDPKQRTSLANRLNNHLRRLDEADAIIVDRNSRPNQFDVRLHLRSSQENLDVSMPSVPMILRETIRYLKAYHPNPILLQKLEDALSKWNRQVKGPLDKYLM